MNLPIEIRRTIFASVNNDDDREALEKTCMTTQGDVQKDSIDRLARIEKVYGEDLRVVEKLTDAGPTQALRKLNQRFSPAHQFLRIMFLLPEQADAIRERAQILAKEDNLDIERDCALLAKDPQCMATPQELEIITQEEDAQEREPTDLNQFLLWLDYPEVARFRAKLDGANKAFIRSKGPQLTDEQWNLLKHGVRIDWTSVQPKFRDAE